MLGAVMLSQLRDLDLQLLRLFVTVVECGGFSAAQGELGIGKSTISTQMAKLETRLGFRLCERGKGGFRLTPKGEQVLSATRKLFSAIDTFKGEAQGMADKLLGQLHLAIGYFSGNQTALDYQPLFRERQVLFCAKGHALFRRAQISLADLQQAARVQHPYRFVQVREPFQSSPSSAQ